MPKIKFDIKAYEEEIRAILNPPKPAITELGLPNLSERIKAFGKKLPKVG